MAQRKKKQKKYSGDKIKIFRDKRGRYWKTDGFDIWEDDFYGDKSQW